MEARDKRKIVHLWRHAPPGMPETWCNMRMGPTIPMIKPTDQDQLNKKEFRVCYVCAATFDQYEYDHNMQGGV